MIAELPRVGPTREVQNYLLRSHDKKRFAESTSRHEIV